VGGDLRKLNTGIDLYHNAVDGVRFVTKRADHPSEASARLKNEIDIYQKLKMLPKQETILSFIRETEGKSSLMLSLEYMERGSVKQLLLSGHALEESQIRIWTFQVTSALVWLHSKDIIWNECSARHVLLDEELNAKISGFGSSCTRRNAGLDEDEIRRGLRWKAPEVVKDRQCRRRSDIWSLGCFIVEILTRADPHIDCKSEYGMTRKLICGRDPTPYLGDVSNHDDLSDFLRHTFEKDASKRLGAKRLILHSFLRKD
jgi:serine/threonine protein kinase